MRQLLAPILIVAAVIHGVSHARGDGVARLVIVVTDATSNKGTVIVSVFASEASWMKEPLFSESLPIREKSARWVIDEIQYGEYAISVIHDENGNGELDTGLMRIPTESYGFSNDAKASFGPASWEDSKFRIESANVRVRVVLDD